MTEEPSQHHDRVRSTSALPELRVSVERTATPPHSIWSGRCKAGAQGWAVAYCERSPGTAKVIQRRNPTLTTGCETGDSYGPGCERQRQQEDQEPQESEGRGQNREHLQTECDRSTSCHFDTTLPSGRTRHHSRLDTGRLKSGGGWLRVVPPETPRAGVIECSSHSGRGRLRHNNRSGDP